MLAGVSDQLCDELLLEAGDGRHAIDTQPLNVDGMPYVACKLCPGGLHTVHRFGVQLRRMV